MGRDKALVAVDGQPMALRVTRALRDAGARDVFCIGGNEPALRALGLDFVVDGYAGEGPLGGIITALRRTTRDVVVVAPCDMPWIEPAHIAALTTALTRDPKVDVAHSEQHLLAAWRKRSRAALQEAFDAGERAPKRALSNVRTVLVELPDGRWSSDVDTPDDWN